ncbi:MAG: Ribonuclease J1 [Alphaproteobacteria bacterium MarineAlpha9_Bin3]|nr:MAG: Ribonuclease J1 [Alphaproteobacteria bacterium MarineAlpha9_Bin3]|tara:strand:+ start:1670 stop:3340 length:1671 start_codon:yes stop_codon:yes gene_type:complete
MNLPKPKIDELMFLPLGGSGEIGMNLNLYGHNGKWLIVDCGVTFGDPIYKSVDVAMPDISSIEDSIDSISGLLLTHAHEDHIGAVHHLWPYLRCPIYATDFAAEVLIRKLKDVGLDKDVKINRIKIDSKINIGPFNIEIIAMSHSIIEPSSALISTEAGNIFHTGDWKIDFNPQLGEGINKKRLKQLSNENIIAMVCDSTNVLVDGTSGSEQDVIKPLTRIIKECKGKVIVSTFASNVTRLNTLSKIAYSLGKSVGLVGQSMWRMVEIAKTCGYLSDLPNFVSERDIKNIDDDKILIICTGSQGEPRGALNRIANGSHRDVSISNGDTVIFSSRVIPGNEVSISEMQNKLSDLGVDIIEASNECLIHVSGHPAKEELSQMYSWVKPKSVIAVHGETRHINTHVKFALEQQVGNALPGRNGSLIQLAPGDPRFIGELDYGRLIVDGNDLITRNSDVLKNRQKMMYNGSVHVVLFLNSDYSLVTEPNVMAVGLAEIIDGDDPEDFIKSFVCDDIKLYYKSKKLDKNYIEESMTLALKRSIKVQYMKKPLLKLEINILN